MPILIDECVWDITADFLTGHAVPIRTCLEAELSGKSDEEIWRYAQRHRIPILTRDKDFGFLNERAERKNWGILLLRGTPRQADALHGILYKVIHKYGNRLRNRLFVIDQYGYRIRTAGE